MQWSGIWDHAVVGYTDSGDYYESHPASGYDVVDTVVACQSQLCGFETTNLVYQLSQSTEFATQQRQECDKIYKADRSEFGDVTSEYLQPCPGTLLQAQRDWGRFRRQRNDRHCYVERTSTSPVQQCCYAPMGYGPPISCIKSIISVVFTCSTEDFGSLVTGGLFGGSVLAYSPSNNFTGYKEKDVAFKETCCGVANRCDLFYERRPANNDTEYEPPVRGKILMYKRKCIIHTVIVSKQRVGETLTSRHLMGGAIRSTDGESMCCWSMYQREPHSPPLLFKEELHLFLMEIQQQSTQRLLLACTVVQV